MDAALDAGFDIYYNPTAGTNHGFAAIGTGGSHRLYAVDVLTGKATSKGAFPAKSQVTALALPINQK
ncbi:DUF4394 domain-containing protein [Streptomyces yangpuensis]|uniref:DUF4394 domain-containing protein n=1 Tax=Streptomyces TaxID=1883 RepID=UPI0004C8D09F